MTLIDMNHAFTRVDYRLELDDATEDQKRAFLAGLEAVCSHDTPALNELRDWLRSLLEEFDIPTRGDREVIERQKVTGGGCYQLEKIKCGKQNCKCASGKLHGPYWYLYQKKNGKVVSKYIGKQRPGDDEPATQLKQPYQVGESLQFDDGSIWQVVAVRDRVVTFANGSEQQLWDCDRKVWI